MAGVQTIKSGPRTVNLWRLICPSRDSWSDILGAVLLILNSLQGTEDYKVCGVGSHGFWAE